MLKTVSVLLGMVLVAGVIFPDGARAQGTLAGDTNGDCRVDGVDYVVVFNHYGTPVSGGVTSGDFNGDGSVDGVDFVILFNNYGHTCPSGTPTRTPTPRPSITPTRTPTPTPVGPTPTLPPITIGNGIWISKEEISRLPIAGQSGCDSFCASAWNAIVSRADSSWGTPNLSDYAGLGHSQGIWAGAIAAAKFSTMPGREADAQRYYNKVVQGLNAVMGTEAAALPSSGGGKDDGSLALSRQFPRYVLAADLLGIYPWGGGYKGYSNYVDYILHTKFTFRVGDGGHALSDRGGACASNGCAMAQAARVAAAAYLKDRAQLDNAWLVLRRYSGDYTSPETIDFSSAGDAWYHNSSAKLAINPKGSTCNGSYPADGVIPNDQGRGGGCPANPGSAPGYTQYPWEGLQGAYAAAFILYRQGYNLAGKNPFQINDYALLRAVEYQWSLQSKFGGSWYDAGRAAWVKHLAYKFYGFKPIQYDPSDGGRNMSHTQWLNQ